MIFFLNDETIFLKIFLENFSSSVLHSVNFLQSFLFSKGSPNVAQSQCSKKFRRYNIPSPPVFSLGHLSTLRGGKLNKQAKKPCSNRHF